ncbi:kinase-like domain-containing protein, partial [Cunninghamella echinulata]
MLSVKNKLQEQQQNENKHIVENTADTNRNSNSNNEKKEEKDLTTKTKKDLNPDLCVFGIGDYQFISLLGKGKFSEVMLAQHYLTGEKFAIKIIDKRSYDERILIRLIREIRIMEVLNHPNIVRIYETIETAYTIYMVMEYISGGNLEEYLKKKGGYLNEQEARAIFRQMISAIDYCHRKWVVHRDIKAQNVLLTENNQIRIVDFGLSNRFGYNRLQTVCGSVFYYSPEMINRKKYIGPEIDCWCLGIFLYRMTAGTEAFANARSEEELRRDIVNRNYNTPDYFSEGLKHTIQKCLSTDRRRRSSLCNALQGDPWLNDYGRLGDLFTDASNYHAAIQKEREQQQQQFLRDIEEEKRTVFQIRKNIIYHAYNKSNYYYTLHGKRDDSMTLESARSKLYQDIRS